MYEKGPNYLQGMTDTICDCNLQGMTDTICDCNLQSMTDTICDCNLQSMTDTTCDCNIQLVAININQTLYNVSSDISAVIFQTDC